MQVMDASSDSEQFKQGQSISSLDYHKPMHERINLKKELGFGSGNIV
jgi:hypothetical protein